MIYVLTATGVTPIDKRFFIIGEQIPLKGDSTTAVGDGSLGVACPLDNVIRRIDLQTRQPHGEPLKDIGRSVGEIIFTDNVLWVANAKQNTVTRIRPSP